MVMTNADDEPDEMGEGLSLYTVDDPAIVHVKHATLEDEAKGCLQIDTDASDNVSGSEWQESFAKPTTGWKVPGNGPVDHSFALTYKSGAPAPPAQTGYCQQPQGYDQQPQAAY
eukprot:13994277-Heterocapsa_arctica.AAC.1